MNITGKNKDDYPMVEKPSYEELEKRIQELEKTESEHKLAEDRMKKIFNNTQDAIFIHDLEGKILDVNDRMCRIYGLTKEEALQVTIEDISSSRMSMKVLLKRWQKVLNGEKLLFEWEARRPKDKSVFNVEVSIQMVSVYDKDIILTNIRDITERKRVEEALIESEKRYRTILNEMSEGYQEVDLAGNFSFFNEAFLNLFGYTREEMAGTSYSRYAAEESIADQVYQTYNEMYKTGKPLQKSEWDIIRKDGQRRTLEYFAAVIKDVNNIPTGFRGIVRDITEIRQAEADQENLRAQLAQAQKMESVGRLAGGVAHDFNNMLSVIMGTAQLARMKMDASDPRYADFEQIEQAARRATEITRKLLAFARKQAISPRQLDLNGTVESMLNMLRRLIGEDIDLVWKPAAHLWPVKMDPTQIDQILANLCVNARDAIDGVGKLTIETRSKTFDRKYCKHHAGFTPGDFVLLAVSDTGCGMDRDTMDNLFDPFFTTKEVGKGTGLGLATVYGIVKQNNGFINVYSEPGQGSIFNIYLPRLVDDIDAAPAVPGKKTAAGGSETILLVEDDPMILEMTTTVLKMLGYTVLAASSPGEAVRRVKNHTGAVHMIMTDVVMPEMNGRDLAGQISDLYPDIKLLFMSGYTADIISHQGVLDEGVAFIQKPFSIEDLTEKLREVLEKTSGKQNRQA